MWKPGFLKCNLHAAVAATASWEDTWDSPGLRFEEWLRDCVMRAVRGYCQAGKTGSLGREESVQVYRKAVKVVLDNERKVSPASLKRSLAFPVTWLAETAATSY